MPISQLKPKPNPDTQRILDEITLKQLQREDYAERFTRKNMNDNPDDEDLSDIYNN